MSIEDRSAKAIAKFKIKAMEDINENSKMNNKAKKRRLVRALSVNSKHNNSLSDMLEQLNGYKNTVEKELEQINTLPNNIQIEEQNVPDILDGKNSEQNVGLEDILKRVDILEKQIKSVFSKYQAERETRLKLENEINKRDNELTLRIACLEEKLLDKDLFNTINIESFKHQRYKINKLVIPHNTLDELIDNNVMPQLEKQTENNEMDVSFVDEVIRDYKPGMLRFKKENEMTDKVNEWPVITFENESETGGSTQNSDQLIQIKNETNNNNNIAYH